MKSQPPALYVDARCLQDEAYQFRGVGSCVTSLLRDRSAGPAARFRAVALTDNTMPSLPPQLRALFDEETICANQPYSKQGSIFLSASPMTHDTRLTLRFTTQPNVLTVAVVYDFIQLDWPGYLRSVSDRIDFAAKLAHLKRHDIFAPISHYSSHRLQDLLQPPKQNICVTGAPVRSSLIKAAARAASPGQKESYFFTLGGADRRKNAETAVKAVAQARAVLGEHIRLKIVGHYAADYKDELKRAAGGSSFVDVLSGISDDELAVLYKNAIATIVPSHIEGFSLPVVEAAVCGSPVIASQCAAHLELIANPQLLFSSASSEELTDVLIRLHSNADLRRAALTEQAPLAGQFREEIVRQRFWSFVGEHFDRRFRTTPAVFTVGGRLPKVALLSPYPPDKSGVARYTERTLQAAKGKLAVDLYTNASRPLASYNGFRDAGPITLKPVLVGYDAVISVLGNSFYHNEILDFFERYGGPCILHDSRLTHITRERLGDEQFCALAARLLKRPVRPADIVPWLHDRDVPTFFIEPVLERAKPLIVHTAAFQKLIEQRYGYRAEVTTFGPNAGFTEEQLSRVAREAARRRIGLPDNKYVIATFGYVGLQKGVYACVVAIEHLLAWGIPAELHVVGSPSGFKTSLLDIARSYGMESALFLHDDYVSDDTYRDYLIGADAGIQLRTYGFGQPSAGLADSISAGLPAVATEGVAEACDAPSYVIRVPDHLSPLLIAEGLATIWERYRGTKRECVFPERAAYCNQHSFEYYVDRLKAILFS